MRAPTILLEGGHRCANVRMMCTYAALPLQTYKSYNIGNSMTDTLELMRLDTDYDMGGFEADIDSDDETEEDDEQIAMSLQVDYFEISSKAMLQAQLEKQAATADREAVCQQQRIDDQISRVNSRDGLSTRERVVRERYPVQPVVGYYATLCTVEDAWEFDVSLDMPQHLCEPETPEEICA